MNQECNSFGPLYAMGPRVIILESPRYKLYGDLEHTFLPSLSDCDYCRY